MTGEGQTAPDKLLSNLNSNLFSLSPKIGAIQYANGSLTKKQDALCKKQGAILHQRVLLNANSPVRIRPIGLKSNPSLLVPSSP